MAYGDALCRSRRPAASSIPLRAALAEFERVGAVPWAERALVELRATAEADRSREDVTWTTLTPQELQVAPLSLDGASKSRHRDQLFLGTRTVEYHHAHGFTSSSCIPLGLAGGVLLTEVEPMTRRPEGQMSRSRG
jgi:hypothetical protein